VKGFIGFSKVKQKFIADIAPQSICHTQPQAEVPQELLFSNQVESILSLLNTSKKLR